MTVKTTQPLPLRLDSPNLHNLLAEIARGAARRDQDRIHPYAELSALKSAGLTAVRLPTDRGGSGWSLTDLLSWTIQLGQADPNVAHSLRNHYTFVEGRLRAADDPAAKRWIDEIAAGFLFGSASTESGSGTVGAQKFTTTLTPDGDGYRLNGVKTYSTGALYADLISIPAITPEGAQVTVVVPGNRHGLHREDDWDGFGQRLTGTGTTRLEDVWVTENEIVERRPVDAPRPTYKGGLSQLYLTAIVAGIIKSIALEGADVLRSRKRTYAHAFAEHPADDPLLHAAIGQIESNAYAAQATVLAAARALDLATDEPTEEHAHEASLQISKTKVVVDQLGMQSASTVFDAGGASATVRTLGLDRHWRNIRTLASHNPLVYKNQAIGAYAVNRTPLPPSGFF